MVQKTHKSAPVSSNRAAVEEIVCKIPVEEDMTTVDTQEDNRDPEIKK